MISLPFKSTIPADISAPLVHHIDSTHPETHPEAFRWDIAEWEQHRAAYERAASLPAVHVNGLETIAKYHGQLVFLLTKLPSDVGIQFLYFPAFYTSPSLPLMSIHYERCAVLFNLAALYSALAQSENRTNVAGSKQASLYYQNAAGCIDYLRTTALSPLLASLDQTTISLLPIEFQDDFLLGIQDLMLAQAQECAWQLASLASQYKNAVLARVAKEVASLYETSLSHFKGVKPPPPFLPQVELQRLHFEAVAQFRKSDDDHGGHKFGNEVTRLRVALRCARQATSHAKTYSLPYEPGPNFIQVLESNLSRSVKDNDFIYNQNPPAEAALPPIQEFSMVRVQPPDGLTQPKKALKGSRVPFSDLMSWGSNVAVDLYENRKENLIQDEIVEHLKQLERNITLTLTKLSLPASLDALSKPIGLPPSIIKKAEEIRNDNGPQRLQIMSENIQALAERDDILLNEALDLLDQEASEDESFRKTNPLSKSKRFRDRLPSHEANRHLTSKAARYRETLEGATKSDAIVRAKMDEIEHDLDLLTLDEEDLEVIIPRSTATDYGSKVTLTKSRELRSLLERLAETQRTSGSILSRVEHLSRTDNIRPRILRESADLEMWTQVEPAMFEPVLVEELVKYERYKEEVASLEESVAALLSEIEEKNEQFLGSRKVDPTVKAREKALQRLDLAYNRYKELLGNLEEGLKFYNDLGLILAAYKEECKQWAFERRESLRDLSELLGALSVVEDASPEGASRLPQPEPDLEMDATSPTTFEEVTPTMAAPLPEKRIPRTLPPSLSSRDWKPMTMPAAPAGNPTPTRKKTATRTREYA